MGSGVGAAEHLFQPPETNITKHPLRAWGNEGDPCGHPAGLAGRGVTPSTSCCCSTPAPQSHLHRVWGAESRAN